MTTQYTVRKGSLSNGKIRSIKWNIPLHGTEILVQSTHSNFPLYEIVRFIQLHVTDFFPRYGTETLMMINTIQYNWNSRYLMEFSAPWTDKITRLQQEWTQRFFLTPIGKASLYLNYVSCNIAYKFCNYRWHNCTLFVNTIIVYHQMLNLRHRVLTSPLDFISFEYKYLAQIKVYEKYL